MPRFNSQTPLMNLASQARSHAKKYIYIMLTMMLSALLCGDLPSDVTRTLIRSNVECQSVDTFFGKASNADDCAKWCAANECRFFIFGVFFIQS